MKYVLVALLAAALPTYLALSLSAEAQRLEARSDMLCSVVRTDGLLLTWAVAEQNAVVEDMRLLQGTPAKAAADIAIERFSATNLRLQSRASDITRPCQ